jgi:hypothetical protein
MMDLVERYLNEKKDKGYRVAKNPNDGSWYVIGHVGGKNWMPVSTGFRSKKEAEKKLMHQLKADSSAKRELKTWDMMGEQISELTKDSIGQAFFDVSTAIGEIVPSVRKQGVDIKITEVVPLRKELDKLEKKIKSRAK